MSEKNEVKKEPRKNNFLTRTHYNKLCNLWRPPFCTALWEVAVPSPTPTTTTSKNRIATMCRGFGESQDVVNP